MSDWTAEQIARYEVACRHHKFQDDSGSYCLCRERTGTNRGFTEHVIDQFLIELANTKKDNA